MAETWRGAGQLAWLKHPFRIIDWAWAAIGGSLLSELMCVRVCFCVCACVCSCACECIFMPSHTHIIPRKDMWHIKYAQLGIVWCQWKEIYLKVMVHSCRSFGVWAWQIVVIELVIAHKHTHTLSHTLVVCNQSIHLVIDLTQRDG